MKNKKIESARERKQFTRITNDSADLQRTPQYTQPRRDIPIPEKDILDPVAEFNHGELAAMDVVNTIGFSGAFAYGLGLMDAGLNSEDFIQGFFDTLRFLESRDE
jgi:hypothetical protein